MADKNRLLTQVELIADMKAAARRQVDKMPIETVRKIAADDYSGRTAMGFGGAIGLLIILAARDRVEAEAADQEKLAAG